MSTTPLAERMRPTTLEEVVGQNHLVGEGGSLRRMQITGDLSSLIFWGPPGTGKTTLAQIIAEGADMEFCSFSAVLSGIKDVRNAMEEAKRLRQTTGRGTLVFVDEIHRFNKAQQDAFLPFVERGDIVLIGATTENPSFEVIGALLSRLTVLVLKPLTQESLILLMERALLSKEGLAARKVSVTSEQLQSLSQYASGDARRALVALEAAVRQMDVSQALSEAALKSVFAGRALLYDKSGDQHYDLISALHKSIRSSQPDAALYWLVRMLRSGEDPNYLARRLVRIAVEDIGLADPNALRLANAAWEAYRSLGSPEGELALAEITIYLAVAPKSNAVYQGMKKVESLLKKGFAYEVPVSLRNASTSPRSEECLPDALAGTTFYEPTDCGVETRIRARLEEIKEEGMRRKSSTPT